MPGMGSTIVRLVGEPCVVRDGEAVALPQSKKTRGLMAYLLWTGRSHRRAQLSDLLWCDASDPRGGLRWSLSKLRGVLDGDRPRVRADREGVSVDASDLEVDVLALRRWASDPESAPTESLAQVLRGMEGEFLEGLDLSDCPEFHAWCVAAREEVRAARASLLEVLVERTAEDPEAALAYARAWVRLDRASDRSHVALMRLLAACGRGREVDEHFRAHRRWLDEHGGTVSPALRQGWHEATAALRGEPAAKVVAEVDAEVAVTSDPGLAAPVPPHQRIRFCRTDDGVRIAYAESGEGPPLVKATHWMSHLEYEWEVPIWHHWLAELGRGRTLLRYDERGNGLSDWEVEDFSLDAFVHDLETVVDEVGYDRFPLFGLSQGCAVAVAYAVRHPERVSKLVLVNGFARGWRVQGRRETIESTEALVTLARIGWGRSHPAFRQTFTSMFFPDAAAEWMSAFNELQRRTTSADNAARLLEAFGVIDVSDLLEEVRTPTLVVHSRYDGLIPFAWGREIATGIPGARFLPLESRNHLLLADEPAWPRFVRELRAFLE